MATKYFFSQSCIFIIAQLFFTRSVNSGLQSFGAFYDYFPENDNSKHGTSSRIVTFQ